MRDGQRKKLSIKRTVSQEGVSVWELQTAEAILARLVARAYAADHPELFGGNTFVPADISVSGLPPAARAEVVAPAARGGSPDGRWSVERYGEQEALDTQ